MKNFRRTTLAVTSVLCLLALSCPIAWADDKDDAEAATKSLFAFMNAGDLPGISRLLPTTGVTEIGPEGEAIHRLGQDAFAKLFASGLRVQFRAERLQVKVLPQAAIVTGLRIGSITKKGETPVEGVAAFTMVWSKADQHWQVQHIHFSRP